MLMRVYLLIMTFTQRYKAFLRGGKPHGRSNSIIIVVSLRIEQEYKPTMG
jgi:hypothetical protein